MLTIVVRTSGVMLCEENTKTFDELIIETKESLAKRMLAGLTGSSKLKTRTPVSKLNVVPL